MAKLIARAAALVPHFRNPRFSASFATAYVHEPDIYTEEHLGQLGVVVEVLGDARQAERLVDLIINTALDHYYALPERDAASSKPEKQFEETIRAVNEALKDYAAAGNSGWVGKISGVIFALAETELLLSLTGSAEAYLYREGRAHPFAAEKNQRLYQAARTFENIISGPLENQDHVLITTPALLHQIAKAELLKLVTEHTPPAAITQIADAINSQRQTDRVAAVVADVLTPELAAANPLPSQPATQEVEAAKLLDDAKTIVQPALETTLKAAKTTGHKLAQGAKTQSLNAVTFTKTKLWPQIKDATRGTYRSVRKQFSQSSRRTLAISGGMLVAVVIITALVLAKGAGSKVTAVELNRFNQDVAQLDQASSALAAGDKATAQGVALATQADAADLAKTGRKKIDARLKKVGGKYQSLASVEQAAADLISRANGLVHVTPKGLLTLSSKHFQFINASVDTIYLASRDGQVSPVDLANHRLGSGNAVNPSLGEIVSSSFSSDAGSIYLLTKEPAVWAYSPASGTLVKQNSGGNGWPQSSFITTYAGNLYLLSTDGNQMLKQTPLGGGSFTGPVSYFTDPLGSAKVLAVDGTIYVITPGNLKHYAGTTLSAQMNVPSSLSHASSLDIASDGNSLILTDPTTKTIGLVKVTDKSLTLDSQFILNGFGTLYGARFVPKQSGTVAVLMDTRLAEFTLAP